MSDWERDKVSDKDVVLRGMQVKKRDVPLGKEFIEDDITYQATMGQTMKFSLVPLNSTFRFGDLWCARMTPGMSYALEPNLPFGLSTSKQVIVQPDQLVRMLVIDRR